LFLKFSRTICGLTKINPGVACWLKPWPGGRTADAPPRSNYDVVGDAFEYFNLAYYEVVEFALAHGYGRIEFGITAYRAKLARGAHLHPLWGYLESWSAPPPRADADFDRWADLRASAVGKEDPGLMQQSGLV
jgi:hypothetical protein